MITALKWHDGHDFQAGSSFLANTLPSRLLVLLRQIRRIHPAIERLGVLLSNDDGSRLLWWADSEHHVWPCSGSMAALINNPSLALARKSLRPRPFIQGDDAALQWACGNDTSAQVIVPVRKGQTHFGYLVLESALGARLDDVAYGELLKWSPLAADQVALAIETVDTLIGTTRFALDFTLMRDRETGEHQLRLREYLRILTDELAVAHGLPNGYSDEVSLFGPIHDIGKVGIPDFILHKPGRFEPNEWEHMKEHVLIGRAMVERMISDFSLSDTPGMRTLHDVVSWHHEALDGSGYPDGMRDDHIPLACRIVSTVDIFDALTCSRPYKRPWPIEEAFAHLDHLAQSHKLDTECVHAMHAARPAIEQVWIQHINARAGAAQPH